MENSTLSKLLNCCNKPKNDYVGIPAFESMILPVYPRPIMRSFRNREIHVSPQITDPTPNTGKIIQNSERNIN